MSSNRMKTGAWAVTLASLASLSLAPALEAQEERGWLGIEVKCSNCRLESRGDTAMWWFSTPPQVGWVHAQGPAARAGLRTGDTLLAVDGVDIVSEDGGRRFGALRPGAPVQFRIRRDGAERTVTVTPGTQREAFGEFASVMRGANWDSLRLQLKELYRGQLDLRVALEQAERALQQTELRLDRQPSEAQRQLARQLRGEIDSIKIELKESNKVLRLYTDSMAARTLRAVPRVMPEIEVSVMPTAEWRTVSIYSDAVAGARFEELTEDSPWLSYLPGVEDGLLIVKIVEGTPAWTAGLREGDVVVEINGQQVHTVADLRQLLQSSPEAELVYVRKGEKQKCKIPSR